MLDQLQAESLVMPRCHWCVEVQPAAPEAPSWPSPALEASQARELRDSHCGAGAGTVHGVGLLLRGVGVLARLRPAPPRVDAALTALLGGQSGEAPLDGGSDVARTVAPEQSPATRRASASPELDKEKVAAFRKALDTADGLPAELRHDLCALRGARFLALV